MCFLFLCKDGVQVANMLTYRMVAHCSSWCEPWLGALSRAPRPEAACYRPRRVPGGDGHTEPLPTARLLFGSGHYPLCRGWNRPPDTSAPLGAMGRAECCGTRLGVLRGWMDYTADGAVRPRPPDSQDKASRLGSVGTPCYVRRMGQIQALTDTKHIRVDP